MKEDFKKIVNTLIKKIELLNSFIREIGALSQISLNVIDELQSKNSELREFEFIMHEIDILGKNYSLFMKQLIKRLSIIIDVVRKVPALKKSTKGFLLADIKHNIDEGNMSVGMVGNCIYELNQLNLKIVKASNENKLNGENITAYIGRIQLKLELLRTILKKIEKSDLQSADYIEKLILENDIQLPKL